MKLFLGLLLIVFTSCHNYTSYEGYGWDILKNERSIPVYNAASSVQLFSNDSSFLVETVFDVVESMNEYKSEVYSSFAGSTTIAESYSKKYTDIKMTQLKRKGTFLRRQYRYAHKNVTLNQSACVVNTGFYRNIEAIAGYYEDNNRNMSNLLIQEVIRAYGTHLVTKTIIGGSLITEAFIADEYYSSFSNKTRLEPLVIAFFNMKYQLGASISTEITPVELRNFTAQILNSSIYSIGGSNYTTNNSLSNWELTMTEQNYEPISIEGIPIYDILTEKEFKGMSTRTLSAIREQFKKIINLYYSLNTHTGCMKRSYRTFSPNSNAHDENYCGNSNLFPNEYSYGGVVLNHATDTDLVNILTNGSLCYPGYREISIAFGNFRTLGFCLNKLITPQKVYFGGGYSDTNDNFATGSKTCAPGFTARQLGTSSKHICESMSVSVDSVPFGGLIYLSLFEGLDDVTNKTTCPKGLEKQLLFSSFDNNPVYVCSLSKITSSVQLIEPPFKETQIVENEENWFLKLDLKRQVLLIALALFFLLLCLFCLCC